MGGPVQSAARVQVRVVHDIVKGLHGGARNAAGLAESEYLVLRQARRPRFDGRIRLFHVLGAGCLVPEPGVVQEFRTAHEIGEFAPVPVPHADDRDVAIGARVEVVRRDPEGLVSIARTWRVGGAEAVVGAQRRGQRRQHGILHRHVDDGALPGLLAAVERRDDGRIEVYAAEHVTQGRSRLQRRLAVVAGDADDAAHGLHGNVHGQVVPMRTTASVARRRGIDQAWVFFQQRLRADAELVHGARTKVLKQYVRPLCQSDDQFTSRFRLQVDRDGLLQPVQHGEREALRTRRASQSLAQGRLDLDDPGACHRQQIAGIGPVIDLTEVEDSYALKRLLTHVFLQIVAAQKYATKRRKRAGGRHGPRIIAPSRTRSSTG